MSGSEPCPLLLGRLLSVTLQRFFVRALIRCIVVKMLATGLTGNLYIFFFLVVRGIDEVYVLWCSFHPLPVSLSVSMVCISLVHGSRDRLKFSLKQEKLSSF